ncbi:MAG: hypothetical protein AAF968_05390 [Pseudomonadota bacterium]
MAAEVTVILDDRTPPPSEITAILGPIRFTEIIRRRRRLMDEIEAAVTELGNGVTLELLRDEAEATAFVRRVEERGTGPLYLRLPSPIMPLRLAGLTGLIDKARYGIESVLVSSIQDDEAVTLMTAMDAITLLRASDSASRRAHLLSLAESVPRLVDYLDFIDLRKPRDLLRFLSGSTEGRHFNVLHAKNGILQKSSADTEKMRAEYAYFQAAPEKMRRFLVPTFDYWEKAGRAGYAMEHLAIPDTALQFIHGAFSPEDFDLLLDQVFAYFVSRPPVGGSPEASVLWQRQITDKMHSRLIRLNDTAQGAKLDAILRAARPDFSLKNMRERADSLLAAFAPSGGRCKSGDEVALFSHGDLCFSNILFDRRLGLMRLIDPRGATTADEAAMHPLYDVAKVSQCVLGGYDFVNNGRFACDLDDTLSLRLTLGAPARREYEESRPSVPQGPPDWAQAAFKQRLALIGLDVPRVRAVELSLFLSMLPLHIDRPSKLAGFALIAADVIDVLETGKAS